MANRFDPLKSYAAGLIGCAASPRSDEVFSDYLIRRGGNPIGSEVAHEWEFAGAGAGKLILLSPAVEQVFPGCWPGPTQLTGDCVAKGCTGALLTSLSLEIASGKPDEVTGLVEGAPEVSPEGIRNVPIASESIWAWRGYDSDGWICSEAAKVASERGFLIRKKYPKLKIDLTKYTDQTNSLGGSRPPNATWLAESRQYVARTATFLKGREQVRDFLFQGYGIFNCSAMAFERTRNEDGFSRQVGIWHHSQCLIGYDDRPDTVKKYGQALVCWLNSWAKWNTGPRRVRGTDLEIPHGAFWTLASTIDRANNIALSSVAGWPRRQHTTYGAAGNI
jgi:hypothetical protein